MGLTMAAEKIDRATKVHALRLLRDEVGGGTIRGSKLFPIERELLQLVPPCEPAALNRRSYIAQVAAQQEGNVVEALRKAGLDAWYPRESRNYRVNATKRRTRMAPLMPGYIFPIFDEHRDNWQVIHPEHQGQGFKGIIRLFGFAERPVPVPDAAIQYMHDQEQHAIAYGKSMRHAPMPAKFAPGNWVQMTDMPWTGFIARVDSWVDYKARIKVVIDIFGRQSLVEVSVTQVRAV